jgi:hypothetical protein
MDETDDEEISVQQADALERELRASVQWLDPVPERVTRLAELSYGWRTLDADLAELAFDSLADPAPVALLRGSGEPRQLSFRHAGTMIEVEIAETADGYELTGQVVPAGPVTVEVRQPGGSVELPVDEAGRFGADRLAAAPVSFRLHPPGAAPLVTEWVSLR